MTAGPHRALPFIGLFMCGNGIIGAYDYSCCYRIFVKICILYPFSIIRHSKENQHIPPFAPLSLYQAVLNIRKRCDSIHSLLQVQLVRVM